MSNIIKTIEFLKENPDKHFIVITDGNNQSLGKENVFIQDIQNQDLEAYIKYNLGQNSTVTNVWVECRRMQGSSSKKVGSYSVTLQAALNTLPATIQESTTATNPPANNLPLQFLGNPGAANQVFGLGVAEVMAMQRNTDRLEDLKEILEDTKKELKELRHEKNLLEIDHRSAVTKLATAEAQKDMAVMMVKNENKSFFDSPAFTSLMEKAPEMLKGYAAMKTGNFEAPTEMLGNAGLSEVKNGFFDIVRDDLTDSEAIFLAQVSSKLKDPIFMQQLQQILL